MCITVPFKSYCFIGNFQYPVVRDGCAVSITPKVPDNLFCPAKWLFGIYYPVFIEKSIRHFARNFLLFCELTGFFNKPGLKNITEGFYIKQVFSAVTRMLPLSAGH